MAKYTGHTITSDSALGSAVIQRSLRFNNNDGTYLERTPSGAGNRKKWTFSAWIKRSGLGFEQRIFGGQANASHIYFETNEYITWDLANENSGTPSANLSAQRYFRDSLAWFHLVCALDTDESTANNRMRMYINGSEVSDYRSRTNPSSGYSTNAVNAASVHTIGRRLSSQGSDGMRLHGYVAEVNFIDGYQYDASYFGYTESQTGLWRPKRYEGTYGTNGFHLDFSDNSSVTTLGIDKSPNGNDFTPNNFSVSSGLGNDSFEDTPTNNSPTLNPLHAFLNGSSSTAENGNLQWDGQSNNQAGCPATMAFPKTGKWYWEVKLLSDNSNFSFGITPATYSNTTNPVNPTGAIGYAAYGSKAVSGVETPNWAATFSSSDNIGAALDMDNKKITFYKNNSAVGSIDLVSGYENIEYLAWIKGDTATRLIQGAINFGGNGFVYTPPSGFKALNSKNLLPNVPSIIRPQRHFETLTYTGDDSSDRTITGLEFKPDFVWIKNRDQGDWHILTDSVRGANTHMYSNTTDGDDTDNANGHVNYYTNDGFNVTAGAQGNVNENSENYVAWCWKAGGTAVSNTDGTITTQVSANTEAGFSAITYTGTGADGTIGHGLGKTPSWVITKKRSGAQDWLVKHSSAGSGKVGYLNMTDPFDTTGSGGGIISDFSSSSTYTVTRNNSGSDNYGNVNASGETYIAYCWSEIPGFSKFGSYTGNGSSDGTYVHLGFRPAWLMVKKSSGSDSWLIMDNKRDIDNVVGNTLAANSNGAENADTGGIPTDFLSNGFKCRGSGGDFNANGQTYVYMAFAEEPGTTPFDTFPNAR